MCLCESLRAEVSAIFASWLRLVENTKRDARKLLVS